MLSGVLYRLRRACRGIGGAGAVPLTGICQTEVVIFADGIVHTDMVLMVDAVAAVAGLVAVGHALAIKRMVGLVLHLPVASAVGEHVRCVYAQFTVIIDDAATRISSTVLVLSPTAHQLS